MLKNTVKSFVLGFAVVVYFSATISSYAVSPFKPKLEKAKGLYRLVKGEGVLCGGGTLLPRTDGSLGFILGPRIIVSAIDEAEVVETQTDSCVTRTKATSESSKVTVLSKVECPGAPAESTVATIAFNGARIHYKDPYSDCLYEKVDERSGRKSAGKNTVKK